MPLHLVAHLQEGLEARAAQCLGDVLTAAAHRLLRLDRVEQPAHLVDIDPGVPDLQESHRRVVGHLGAVTADGQARRGVGVPVREAVVSRRHGEAGRQALDIPLERRRERLIEVIDVEDQPPVGRGEHAKVQQVSIAARLHPDISGGRVRQIPRHRRGRAAEVGKRRGGHAPVPDRQQIWYPRLGLLLQGGDRVWPVLRRRPLRVAQPGHQLAPLTARGTPLIGREHLVRRGQNARRSLDHQLTSPTWLPAATGRNRQATAP